MILLFLVLIRTKWFVDNCSNDRLFPSAQQAHVGRRTLRNCRSCRQTHIPCPHHLTTKVRSPQAPDLFIYYLANREGICNFEGFGAELVGDVVLFRNDDNAEPVDLSLAEWKDFAEVPHEKPHAGILQPRLPKFPLDLKPRHLFPKTRICDPPGPVVLRGGGIGAGWVQNPTAEKYLQAIEVLRIRLKTSIRALLFSAPRLPVARAKLARASLVAHS